MNSEIVEDYHKRLLATIFCKSIKNADLSSKGIAEELAVNPKYVDGEFNKLADKGMVFRSGEKWSLTNEGRKQIVIVLTGGVFDILHPGHLFTLKSAKKLGDALVVSVARDNTVKRVKGHFPINGEETRNNLVGSLRCVDVAVLGSDTDIFEVVERVKPDVIALGHDQKHDIEEIGIRSKQLGLQIKIVRFSSPMPEIKSSSIIKNIDALEEI